MLEHADLDAMAFLNLRINYAILNLEGRWSLGPCVKAIRKSTSVVLPNLDLALLKTITIPSSCVPPPT